MDGFHYNVCVRIYELWHAHANNREGQKILDLYVDDAIPETPLAMAILDDNKTTSCVGVSTWKSPKFER